MKRSICAVLLLAAVLFLLPSCGRGPKRRTVTFFAMDTVMDMAVYGDPETLTEAEATVRAVEDLLSVTKPGSAVAALNREGAVVSPEAAALIARVRALCERTGGTLDPTVYPVLRAWGFTTGTYRVPGEDEIAALLPVVGYEKITVDGDRVTISEGSGMDLGSVGKGYAADLLAAQLRAAGVESALLNLGGNVQAVGAKPNGEDWRVAIRDPGGEAYAATVAVRDRAVVTSGGYERCFERDGVRYHHILDPKTGAPARSGLTSVTVICESGLLADALSTALFVMGPEAAADHWRAYRDFEAVFLLENSEIRYTEGLETALTVGPAYAGKATVIRP